MKTVEKKKKTTSELCKQLENLEKLAAFCKNNHVFEVKLADGTCLTMHQLAFYTENNDISPVIGEKQDDSTNNQLDMGLSLSEDINEEILFMSARS